MSSEAEEVGLNGGTKADTGPPMCARCNDFYSCPPNPLCSCCSISRNSDEPVHRPAGTHPASQQIIVAEVEEVAKLVSMSDKFFHQKLMRLIT